MAPSQLKKKLLIAVVLLCSADLLYQLALLLKTVDGEAHAPLVGPKGSQGFQQPDDIVSLRERSSKPGWKRQSWTLVLPATDQWSDKFNWGFLPWPNRPGKFLAIFREYGVKRVLNTRTLVGEIVFDHRNYTATWNPIGVTPNMGSDLVWLYGSSVNWVHDQKLEGSSRLGLEDQMILPFFNSLLIVGNFGVLTEHTMIHIGELDFDNVGAISLRSYRREWLPVAQDGNGFDTLQQAGVQKNWGVVEWTKDSLLIITHMAPHIRSFEFDLRTKKVVRGFVSPRVPDALSKIRGGRRFIRIHDPRFSSKPMLLTLVHDKWKPPIVVYDFRWVMMRPEPPFNIVAYSEKMLFTNSDHKRFEYVRGIHLDLEGHVDPTRPNSMYVCVSIDDKENHLVQVPLEDVMASLVPVNFARKQCSGPQQKASSGGSPSAWAKSIDGLVTKEDIRLSKRIMWSEFEGVVRPGTVQSKLASWEDMNSSWYRGRVADICETFNPHRKQWEYLNIIGTIDQLRKLGAGHRGLGIGVGGEPIAAYFASRSTHVLISDVPPSTTDTIEWQKSLIESAHRSCLIDSKRWKELAEAAAVNANKIPERLLRGEFDFLWGTGVVDKIGTIEQAKKFILNSMRTLNRGGVAVFTAEFSLDRNGDRRFEVPGLSIWTKSDVEDIADRVEHYGARMLPMNWALGESLVDLMIDKPPFNGGRPHLKLVTGDEYNPTIHTSILMVFQRDGTPASLILSAGDNAREDAEQVMSPLGVEMAKTIRWDAFPGIPRVGEIESKLVTWEEMESNDYYKLTDSICELPSPDRRQWEEVSVIRVLEKELKLSQHSYGLGINVGDAPIASYLVAQGVRLTLLVSSESAASENNARICLVDKQSWKESVRSVVGDLSQFPERLYRGSFDFVWSAGTLPRFGSVELAMHSILNSFKTLVPGGIAVHTTDISLDRTSMNERFLRSGHSIWTKADVEELQQKAKTYGARMFPVNWALGRTINDFVVDAPPTDESRPRLKAIAEGTTAGSRTVFTSIMLVFKRDETPPETIPTSGKVPREDAAARMTVNANEVAKRIQWNQFEGTIRPGKIESKLATWMDMAEGEWYSKQLKAMCTNFEADHLQWATMFIAEVMQKSELLGAGRTGISFGSSDDDLAEFLARHGASVTSTTHSAANNCSTDSGTRDLITQKDLNIFNLPKNLHKGSFDFLISNHVLHEAKNISEAKAALWDSMRLVRTNGIVVHSVYISLDQAAGSHYNGGDMALFTPEDIVELAHDAKKYGTKMVPVNWALGNAMVDYVVDSPPFSAYRPRLKRTTPESGDHEQSVYTSLVLIFHRDDLPAIAIPSYGINPVDDAIRRMSPDGVQYSSRVLWEEFSPGAAAVGNFSSVQSKVLTWSDMNNDWYRTRVKAICEPINVHRKQWEFMILIRSLEQLGMIAPGKRGLGYNVGRDRVASYFASQGVEVTLADASLKRTEVLANAEFPCIVNATQWRTMANVETADLLLSSPRLIRGDYDFVWSVSVLEASGTIESQKQGIFNSLKALKAGGIAVHTTEVSIDRIGPDDRYESAGLTLWTKADVADLEAMVAKENAEMLPMNWAFGDSVNDLVVDSPPFDASLVGHFKLGNPAVVYTNMVLVFRKLQTKTLPPPTTKIAKKTKRPRRTAAPTTAAPSDDSSEEEEPAFHTRVPTNGPAKAATNMSLNLSSVVFNISQQHTGDPKIGRLGSRMVNWVEVNSSWYRSIVEDLCEPFLPSRGQWERVVTLSTIQQRVDRNQLDAKAIVYLSDPDPLIPFIADKGVDVTVVRFMVGTARPPTPAEDSALLRSIPNHCSPKKETWTSSCNVVNANLSAFPDASEQGQYDYLWSIGSVQRGVPRALAKHAILRSLRLLKSGGIAIHTVDVFLGDVTASVNETIFTKQDIEDIGRGARAAGAHLLPMNWALGSSPEDSAVGVQGCNRTEFGRMENKTGVLRCIATPESAPRMYTSAVLLLEQGGQALRAKQLPPPDANTP